MTQIGFSHNEIWSYFLQTFTGEPDLTVTKVENNYITFKSNSININLFKDPEAIKSTVIHSYSHKVKASSYLTLNAKETVDQLVDSDFLQDLKINLGSDTCKDDVQAKVITCSLQASSIFQLKQLTEGFKNLQSLFQSEDQLSNIMLGNNKRLKEDDFTGEKSSYGEEIIEMVSDLKSKSASVSIQYGKILTSAEQASIKKPEVTESKDVEQEYALDKNVLLSYAQNIIPSGVIYAQTSHGLQPILFQSMKSDKPNNFQSSVFDFIIDISGSMSHDLPKVQVKLVELISRIIGVTNNWEIKITPFSDYSYPTTSFSSSKKSDIDGISAYVNKLDTVSGTALYKTMHEVYLNTIADTSADKNNVIFTITDGQDTAGVKTSSDIIYLAKSLREQAPQSTIYNIGYSSYDRGFFNDLSQNSASKTIHLDSINDLEELYKDMDTINNCKVLYEFGSNQYAQCAAGDIFITSFTINENTQVKVGGEVYNIGVESTTN